MPCNFFSYGSLQNITHAKLFIFRYRCTIMQRLWFKKKCTVLFLLVSLKGVKNSSQGRLGNMNRNQQGSLFPFFKDNKKSLGKSSIRCNTCHFFFNVKYSLIYDGYLCLQTISNELIQFLSSRSTMLDSLELNTPPLSLLLQRCTALHLCCLADAFIQNDFHFISFLAEG